MTTEEERATDAVERLTPLGPIIHLSPIIHLLASGAALDEVWRAVNALEDVDDRLLVSVALVRFQGGEYIKGCPDALRVLAGLHPVLEAQGYREGDHTKLFGFADLMKHLERAHEQRLGLQHETK